MKDETNYTEGALHKRRRHKKRKPVLGLLPRFTAIGVGALLAIAIVVAFVGKLDEPFALEATQGRQIADLKTQVDAAQRENADLEIRRDSLNRPEGIEVAARSQGYLRKGEQRLVLEVAPTPLPDERPSESAVDRMRSAWLSFVGR